MAAPRSDPDDDVPSQNERWNMPIEVIGWHAQSRSHAWSPPTDLYETDECYIVRMEIAGLREQDFSVKLDKARLVISGIRSDEPGRRAYHQMEVRFGEFSTAIALPGPVDGDGARAEYEDGFLQVILPKSSSAATTES